MELVSRKCLICCFCFSVVGVRLRKSAFSKQRLLAGGFHGGTAREYQRADGCDRAEEEF